MGQARIQVINETKDDETAETFGGWTIWLQWCRYFYEDGSMEHGYRYIWKRPDGTLQAARGQARLPSFAVMQRLMKKAEAKGWGDYDATTMPR
jgi:hypothetical protein